MRHSSIIPRVAFRAFGVCSRVGAARILFSVFVDFSAGVAKKNLRLSPSRSALSAFRCVRFELFGSRSRAGPCAEEGSGLPGVSSSGGGCSPNRRRGSVRQALSAPGIGTAGVSGLPRRGAHSAERPARALRVELDDEQSSRDDSELGFRKNEPLRGRVGGDLRGFHTPVILPGASASGNVRSGARCFRGAPSTSSAKWGVRPGGASASPGGRPGRGYCSPLPSALYTV